MLPLPEVQESSTRSQIFATGYCCPYRGSWPPSDLLPKSDQHQEISEDDPVSCKKRDAREEENCQSEAPLPPELPKIRKTAAGSLVTLRNCQVTDTKPCFLAPKMGSLLCPFCWHLPRGARMAGPPPKNSWDCQFPTMPLTQRINDIPITLRTIPMMVKKTHPTQICTDEALNEQLPSKKTFTYISFCQFGKHVAFGTL